MSIAEFPEIDKLTTGHLVSASERLTRHGLRLLANGLAPNGAKRKLSVPDPLGLGDAMVKLSASMMSNPGRIASAQIALWCDYAALSQRLIQRMWGVVPDPVITPEQGDRRFKDVAWDENAIFDVIKQAYLLTAQSWIDLVSEADGLDPDVRQKLEFAFRQVIDALSPSNFAATNPEVLRATIESGGRNLVDGLHNLLDDLESNGGTFEVSMTDNTAFEVGENLAITPGKVVFQNDLMQLIQYAPTTEKVIRRPMLIIPPWMNKFYVMDLRPGNSMIQWLVDQGHTVFVISWVNPGRDLAHKGFENYMLEGPIAAMDAIAEAVGEREVNVVGYCLGGILLAAAAAYLSAKGDNRIKSASYFTTMVDFSDVGDISMFIDEDGLEALEEQINDQGYLDGGSVAATFRVLRANDLIWSFFVNSYLLGKGPRPFDILYWNSDSTNMPAAMHTFFMRNMYLKNLMREPGGVTLDGVPIDVTRVKTPAYILSTREDHIAPWKTTYASTQLFSGPVKFVLGASGHIAGVINPPQKDKYGYWTNSKLPQDPDEWLDGAREHQGSWWPDWMRWMKRYRGGEVDARIPGEGGLPPIEDAPGSYVKVRLADLS